MHTQTYAHSRDNIRKKTRARIHSWVHPLEHTRTHIHGQWWDTSGTHYSNNLTRMPYPRGCQSHFQMWIKETLCWRLIACSSDGRLFLKIIIRLFYYVGEGARALMPMDSSKSKPWMHTERCELKPSLTENYFTVTSGTPRLGLLRSRCLNVFWMHPGESCAGRIPYIKAASFLRKNLLN